MKVSYICGCPYVNKCFPSNKKRTFSYQRLFHENFFKFLLDEINDNGFSLNIFEHQIRALLLFDIELMEVCKCVSNNENRILIDYSNIQPNYLL